MSGNIYWWLVGQVTIILIWMFGQFRINRTYAIRVHFISHEPKGHYELLPDFDQMLYRHLGKWTVDHRRKYVAALAERGGK